MTQESIEVKSKWGGVTGLTSQTFALFCSTLMAALLVWQLSVGITLRLDRLVEFQGRTAVALERLIDRLDGRTTR